MNLIEVEVVRAQTAQAVFAFGDDPPSRITLRVGIATHIAVNFGSQNHGGSIEGRQCLANNDLRLSLGVDVRGVNEVDARVERPVNYSDRVVVIRVAPGAKHHGTQTEWADFYSGATKAV